ARTGSAPSSQTTCRDASRHRYIWLDRKPSRESPRAKCACRSAFAALLLAIDNPAWLRSSPRSLRNHFANARIGSASAQVAAQAGANGIGRGMTVLIQECLAGNHKSRCAETAL